MGDAAAGLALPAAAEIPPLTAPQVDWASRQAELEPGLGQPYQGSAQTPQTTAPPGLGGAQAMGDAAAGLALPAAAEIPPLTAPQVDWASGQAELEPGLGQPYQGGAQTPQTTAPPGPGGAQATRASLQPSLGAAQVDPGGAPPDQGGAQPGQPTAPPGLGGAQPGQDHAQPGEDGAQPGPDGPAPDHATRRKSRGHWQWHHRASSALGFHPPRWHLSRGATIAVAVAALAALVAIPFAVLELTGGGSSDPAPTEAPLTPAAPTPGETGATDWSVGRGFDTGGFSIEIVSYWDAVPALSADGSEVAENGQWVLVGIRVKNTGDEEGTFVPDQQSLTTEAGQTYSNEPASALKHADFKLGTSPIAVGQSQVGYLAFDIPIDARPSQLSLVGRVGEPPVSVPLG
ncbi:MAG: DUF4352 domain-containing protein [Bifidobacteriaceae bacterium]|jgi:hypothetical protein|nr:DUF4352 domain-containing protein [Bifidobacteriaceae bacterium]